MSINEQNLLGSIIQPKLHKLYIHQLLSQASYIKVFIAIVDISVLLGTGMILGLGQLID